MSRTDTTLRLSGPIQSANIGNIRAQIDDNRVRIFMDLYEVTLVDVEVVRFLSECEDRGIVLAHCPPYVHEWILASEPKGHSRKFQMVCVIRDGDTYFARVERSLLSNSLSACRSQPTSKGESIGSRSVLDSTLVPVVRFRHLSSVRHMNLVMTVFTFNALVTGMTPAYLRD